MATDTLCIGTRGSDLALWQARWVERELLRLHPGMAVRVETIKTTGDRVLDAPLSRIGDKGLFTREIEQALLDGQIDIAVHSLKDLPTELPQGLVLGAVTAREDVRDVFIPHPNNPRRRLQDQERGAVIATGSLRRKCQLHALGRRFEVVDIRGNLNTRMRKLEDSGWAGMLLARAGVVRLGWEDRIGETIDPSVILPAVGQGALGIEVREKDGRVLGYVRALEHEPTMRSTSAERALLRRLEGGCQVPIGTYGRITKSASGARQLVLDAMVGSLDGHTIVRGTTSGEPAQAAYLGESLADTLLRGGADSILRTIRSSAGIVR